MYEGPKKPGNPRYPGPPRRGSNPPGSGGGGGTPGISQTKMPLYDSYVRGHELRLDFKIIDEKRGETYLLQVGLEGHQPGVVGRQLRRIQG